MTNRLALVIACLLIGLIAADQLYFGWDLHIFLGRKFTDFIEYIAFWR